MTLVNDWRLIVLTPTGGHCWRIGDPAPEIRDDLVLRARALLGFPHGDEWARNPTLGWRIQLSPGEPHPDLMQRCRRRSLPDLGTVGPEQVQAWVDADAEARRRDLLDQARAALALLHEDDLAVLHAEMGATAAKQPAV